MRSTTLTPATPAAAMIETEQAASHSGPRLVVARLSRELAIATGF
jgi:hypothetical protein